MKKIHPRFALFEGEKPFPIIPACEHFAGSEKLIRKAMELQKEMGPIFDITCDLEDGAPRGKEKDHAEMVVRLLHDPINGYQMAGVRVHDYHSPYWKSDMEIVLSGAGERLCYLTIPKPTSYSQVAEMVEYMEKLRSRYEIRKEIPVHVLIETHGALRDVWKIAEIPQVQVLDFGLMDFVSGHHGAISDEYMRSPGQFEHKLIVRAKAEVVAAALACGVVPSHNVTLDLKNPYQTYEDARRAREEFGFLRMWSIYPTQIRAIVDAFKPDFSQVEKGAKILLLAQESNWGPIQFEGELHDRATYRYYWELLQRAKVTGVPIPPEADKAFFSEPVPA
jgi:citrate lyase subunit beta/citryl-CoA lyase